MPVSVPFVAVEFGPSTAAPERNGGPFGGLGTMLVTWCCMHRKTYCHRSRSRACPIRSRPGCWPVAGWHIRPGWCRCSARPVQVAVFRRHDRQSASVGGGVVGIPREAESERILRALRDRIVQLLCEIGHQG
jgi:hypothetical protein